MATEMLSASQGSAAVQYLVEALHTLRYELTAAIMLLVLWGMGQLASATARQKKPSPKGKLASLSPPRPNKVPSPRTMSRQSQAATSKALDTPWETSAPPTPVEQLGPIEEIDVAQLCNASWVVPQVTYMCRTHVQQSLALYRTALNAGLNLNEMPEDGCQHLFVALVTSTIRTGHMHDTMQLLRDLRKLGPGIHTSLFCSVAKLCTSKHLFAECLAVYDFMSEDSGFALTDKSVWSCLLFSSIEVHAYDRCSFFFQQLKDCGMPSQKDYGNMIRLAALQSDWKLSLKLIGDMQQEGIAIDSIVYNTALGTCVAANQIDSARDLLEQMQRTEGLADVITYNSLMKGYAKTGCMDQCFEIFQLLKQRSISPSQVTYGILLDGYINENQLERAARVFSDMSAEGYSMNTVLYTTLIKGFARAGEVDQAMNVYDQMRRERNVTPDLITFSILIKANCDSDRLEEALKLLEAMCNLKLQPDEVVFNSLLAGCARSANAKLGKRLYADMLACGIRPSNATFSILIRFYMQCKLLGDAVEMLRTEPAKHKVDPEPRIFVQLIRDLVRERQGQRAVEVYKLLADRSVPSASTHRSVFSTCVKLNMYDTASEILDIAARKRAHVDRTDADELLEGAFRKRKVQVAHDIAASMERLGMSVDKTRLPAKR